MTDDKTAALAAYAAAVQSHKLAAVRLDDQCLYVRAIRNDLMLTERHPHSPKETNMLAARLREVLPELELLEDAEMAARLLRREAYHAVADRYFQWELKEAEDGASRR